MSRPDPALEGAPLIPISKVHGVEVFDVDGDKIGEIEDVVLHKLSGRVAYALLSWGGFMGVGEQYHPLPWSALTYDPERGGYVVPLDKEQLRGAPAVPREEARQDGGWRERVHQHFQASPYWL